MGFSVSPWVKKALIIISVAGFWIVAGLLIQSIAMRNQSEAKSAVAEIDTGTPETVLAAPVSPSLPRVFEFNGEDLGKVLRTLARAGSINMVVSDQVAGTVTLRLTDITPVRGIDIIAKSKGLFVSVVDDVYFVKTAAEWEQEPREHAEFHLENSTLAQSMPLLQFKYGTQSELKGDERTNTVLYRARISSIEKIRQFLQWIDRPTSDFALTLEEFHERNRAAEAALSETHSEDSIQSEASDVASDIPLPPTGDAIAPLEPVTSGSR